VPRSPASDKAAPACQEEAISTPEDLKYTPEHEWARPSSDGAVIRIGITDYAQSSLGDVVFVSLPELDAEVSVGASIGEVESTKSVSDINSDPYGEGWMVEITVADKSAIDTMLDAAAYQGMLEPH
jgi:glycine cleavage system H protein